MKRIFLELGLWALTLAFVIVRLSPALIDGTSTFAHDNLYWGFPYYKFYAEELLAGRLTLWNPYSHGGESLVTAYFQLRMYDPVSVITTAVSALFTDSAAQLFSWDRLVRIYIGCFGTWLLVRNEVRSPLVRLSLIPVICLSSLALNGFHQNAFPDQYYCAVFFLYFLFRILQDGDQRWRNWIGMSVFFGVSLQSYFFTGGALAFFWIVLGVLLFRRECLIGLLRARANGSKAAASLAVVALMAAPMLVYVLQMSGELAYPARYLPPNWTELAPAGGPFYRIRSYEADAASSLFMSYGVIAATGTNLTLPELVTLWSGPRLFPPAVGEAALFLGSLPFAIALFGIAFGRHRFKPVWMTLLAGMALLALGRDGGLHNLLYYVLPPLWFVRHTHGLSLFILLALFFFYAIGFERLLELEPLPLFPLLSRWLPATTLAVLVVYGAVLAAGNDPGWDARLLVLGATLVAPSLAVLLADFPAERENRMFALQIFVLGVLFVSLGAAFLVAEPAVPTSLWRRPLLLAGTLLFAAYLAIKLRMQRQLAFAAICACIAVTLGFAEHRGSLLFYYVFALLVPLLAIGMPWKPKGVRVAIFALSAVVSAVQLGREFWYDRERLREVPEDTRIETAEQAPLPRRTVFMSEENRLRGEIIRNAELLERTPAALDPLLGHDAGEDAADLSIEAFGKVGRFGVWNSFSYQRGYAALVFSGLEPKVLARAFLIDESPLQFYRDWMVAPDFVESMRRAPTLVVEKAPSFPSDGKHAAAAIRVLAYRSDDLTVRVEAAEKGLLYFADGYDPHWKATLNGTPVEIIRANGNFKAIAVPAGESVVRMSYRPSLFLAALVIFQALFAGGLLFLLWSALRREAPPPVPGPSQSTPP